MKLNKLLLFFCFGLFFFGFSHCSTFKRSVGPEIKDIFEFTNYEKIRFTIDDGKEIHTFKGHIYIIRDSLISFKLWGPLGFEIGSGLIGEQFKFYNSSKKLLDNDLKIRVEEVVGIIVSKEIFSNILLADVSSLEVNLDSLNKNILTFNNYGKRGLMINNRINSSSLLIKYEYKNNGIKNIFMEVKNPNSQYKLMIDILETSHNNKFNLGPRDE